MRIEDFAGDWAVERAIEDARARRGGAFAGLARLVPAPGGLAYVERGRLRLGDGPAVEASRRYLWRGEDDAVAVHFEDGRFFHRFRPDDGAPVAHHDCPPDAYRVRYDFADWPVWRAEWRVSGPRKDYATVTVYRPAGDPATDTEAPP